jgi:hypothetical protein
LAREDSGVAGRSATVVAPVVSSLVLFVHSQDRALQPALAVFRVVFA